MCEFISGFVDKNGYVKIAPSMDSHSEAVEYFDIKEKDILYPFEWTKNDDFTIFMADGEEENKKLSNELVEKVCKKYGSRNELILQTAIEHCKKGKLPAIWEWEVNGWGDKEKRLFACDCAERVLPIYEKHMPNDSRVRDCIVVARKYAYGEVDDTTKNSAWDAAWDASCDTIGATSCDTVGDVAWNSVSAIAWNSARAAAMAAAWDAAWAAAWNSARAAARAAAWNSAWDAAWDAEEKEQAKILLDYLMKIHH